jgi:gluconolactonase
MHPWLKIFNESAKEFIHFDFEVEVLADDGQFTEGPVWNPKGYYLFSDITANCICRIVPGNHKELFHNFSGTTDPFNPDLKHDMAGSNGLAYDNAGTLLVCRHGSHDIGKYADYRITPFIESFNGKPFNSPNDIVVSRDGRIFFSDPPYGLKEGKLNPEKFQPVAGVYFQSEGEIKLVCREYKYPNGLCLSPDQKKLFICSNKPFENFVMEYDSESLQFNKIIAHENGDGMKSDQAANLYLCNKDGLLILDSNGKRLALLEFPTIPANICWGGTDLKDLFVCARNHIFLVKDFLK